MPVYQLPALHMPYIVLCACFFCILFQSPGVSRYFGCSYCIILFKAEIKVSSPSAAQTSGETDATHAGHVSFSEDISTAANTPPHQPPPSALPPHSQQYDPADMDYNNPLVIVHRMSKCTIIYQQYSHM